VIVAGHKTANFITPSKKVEDIMLEFLKKVLQGKVRWNF